MDFPLVLHIERCGKNSFKIKLTNFKTLNILTLSWNLKLT